MFCGKKIIEKTYCYLITPFPYFDHASLGTHLNRGRFTSVYQNKYYPNWIIFTQVFVTCIAYTHTRIYSLI